MYYDCPSMKTLLAALAAAEDAENDAAADALRKAIDLAERLDGVLAALMAEHDLPERWNTAE